jgi:Undecaprenyl-phosphate glucose phosphotransferase
MVIQNQEGKIETLDPRAKLSGQEEDLSVVWRNIQFPRISCWLYSQVIQNIDSITVIMTAILALYISFWGEYIDFKYYAAPIVVGVLFSRLIFEKFSLYLPERLLSYSSTARALIPAWIVSCASIALVDRLSYPNDFTMLDWEAWWFGCGLVVLVGGRLIVTKHYQHNIKIGRVAQSLVLLGGGALGTAFMQRLRGNLHGFRALGFFDDRRERVPTTIDGVPRLGGTRDLFAFISDYHVDTVVIALPMVADKRLIEIIQALRRFPVDLRILPDFLAFEVSNSITRQYSDLPDMMLLPIANRPIAGINTLLKQIEDKVLAFTALTLLSPILLACAIGIKLTSPGPVFYRQPRQGFKGHEFMIYKFRTMHAADSPAQATTLTARGDPRIFPWGAWLRRTSADELPQLFNVLLGDMSLVGPRPHLRTARVGNSIQYDEAVAEYAARHRVKPGITGWAQVNGWRGPTEVLEQIQKRVEHDIYYIDNWSVTFDLWILMLTVVKIFSQKNAF